MSRWQRNADAFAELLVSAAAFVAAIAASCASRTIE